MTRIIICFCLLVPLTVSAQFKTATIAIDGLTCSMCSYGVEKSIGKLKFVNKVKVDLNSNIASVEFKDNTKTDIRKLIQSVADAGFTVRTLSAGFYFDNSVTTADTYFRFEDYIYILLDKQSGKKLDGLVELKFVEKAFSEPEFYRKYKSIIVKNTTDSFTNQSYYFVII